MEANELKDLVFKRTGIQSNELTCPREKSDMTPCIARDGDMCMLEDKTCVGCGANAIELLEQEKSHH